MNHLGIEMFLGASELRFLFITFAVINFTFTFKNTTFAAAEGNTIGHGNLILRHISGFQTNPKCDQIRASM